MTLPFLSPPRVEKIWVGWVGLNDLRILSCKVIIHEYHSVRIEVTVYEVEYLVSIQAVSTL
jgi:hypothetical protein